MMIGVVWLLVLHSIMRGYRREKRVDRYAVITWGIFIAIALVITLRNNPFTRLVNNLMGVKPGAYWLSTLVTLGGLLLYSMSVKMILPDTFPVPQVRRMQRVLHRFAGVIFIGLVVVLWATRADYITHFQARNLMRLVLDVYVSLLMALVLIPINRWMLQHEQIEPMRIKHRATITLCIIYIVSTVSALVFIPPAIVRSAYVLPPHLIPRGPLALVCLAVVLLPHRWIVFAYLPLHVYRYWRIVRVERRIVAPMHIPREPFEWRRVLQTHYVEFATYTTLISILDNFRWMIEEDHREQQLGQQIETLMAQHPDYYDLVKAISRVKL